MSEKIVIPIPDDWHCHLREGPLTQFVVKHLIENGFRGRVLAEPNLKEAVLTGSRASWYKGQIENVISRYNFDRGIDPHIRFQVVSTIQITKSTTYAIVHGAYRLGTRVGKVYPKDVTTNSENGVVDYEDIYPALTAAEECGMIIQFHGEHPSHDVEGPRKEMAFIQRILPLIIKKFPKLKISLEHISTAFAVHWIRSLGQSTSKTPRIVAALAPQYLYLTSDDVEGYTPESNYKGHPEIIFKPKAKWNEDRAFLQAAAVSGEPWFVLGTDAAAHYDSQKTVGGCNCGSFNIPVCLPILAEIFKARESIHNLPVLIEAGQKFYGFPPNKGHVVLEEKEWQVPLYYNVEGTREFVTPMIPGRTLKYRIKEIV